jgi:serine kinase of HPr protein (carbohydrate metabolism regulator)
MTIADGASIHATAVLVGNHAVVIRGPSGSGKSRLALDLLLAGRAGQIAPSVLIGDDRVHLLLRKGQLVVRPARELAGLIEIRGLGIRRCEYAQEAVVGMVVDLSADDAERLPRPETLLTQISGIKLPRIPVGSGFAALPLVLAALIMEPSSSTLDRSVDCSKGIGNHISPTIATD